MVMKIILIILGYAFMGAIVASAWEKTELTLLKWGYSIKPLLLEKYPPDLAWHTNTLGVRMMIILWPLFLVASILWLIYLLIRKIFGL
jgi:hypothetical protein